MFSKAFIVFSFFANQDYIAKNLCENRTKPKSCCAGKCQLRKRLNKDTNEDKQNNERKTGKESEVVTSNSFTIDLPSPIYTDLTLSYTSFLDGKPIDKSYPIFRPPGV